MTDYRKEDLSNEVEKRTLAAVAEKLKRFKVMKSAIAIIVSFVPPFRTN